MAKNRYDLFVLGVVLLGMHVGASDTCGVTGDCGVAAASLLQKHSTMSVKDNNDHYDVDTKASNTPKTVDAIKYLGGSDKVDINNANVQAYRQFPGMYPTAAAAIATHGPYSKVSDIYDIPGLEERVKDIMKKYQKHFVCLPPNQAYVPDRVNNGMYRSASLLQKHSTKSVKENNDHYGVDIKAGNTPKIRVEHYDVEIKDSSLTEKAVRNLMDKWFQSIGGDGSDPDLEKQVLNTWAGMFTPEACMTGFHLGFEDESQHGFVQEVCGVKNLIAKFSDHMHTRGSPTTPIEVYQNKLEFKACVSGPESEIGTHREGMIAEHAIMVEGKEQLQISKAIGTLTKDGCS